MIFRYTILYVVDVAATLNFYREAFGFETAFLHESGDYGELATGDTKLSFSSHRLMRELGKNFDEEPIEHPAWEIAFETDDVAAALTRAVAAGGVMLQNVEHMPWGQTTAYIRAPEGTLIEICTAVQAPQ